jgi:hypothetical protein
MPMYATTIDLGDDTTVVVEQHDLLARLEQLAAIRDHGAFADDHAVHVLLDRYRSWQERQDLRNAPDARVAV